MRNSFAIIVCLAAVCRGADSGTAAAVEDGTASFVVNTTVPGISVKGKSSALEAHALVQRVPEGLRLEKVEASIAVASIRTGMALRDEHMRRYIFTTADGKTPDLRFENDAAPCAAQSGRGNEFSCQVMGTLTIRGVAKPFSVPLKIRADGTSFRVSGDSAVKLSDYGIEQPSQFGVKTSDEVQLHLDFTGKEVPAKIATGGRR
jgi:polyisoprenoid-binding protein YceI